jgi:peroxiredoxin
MGHRLDNRTVLKRIAFLAFALICSLYPAAHGQPPPMHTGAKPAPIMLMSSDGSTVQPLRPVVAGEVARVFIFVAHDCPISNAYAPEINRICFQYNQRGIDFALVSVDPEVTFKLADAAKFAAAHAFRAPLLLDPNHRLSRQLGATCTPEAVVVSTSGGILYRGRIDDRFVDFGTERDNPTVTDLRDAIDDALAGHSAPKPWKSPVGCSIPNQ